MYIFDDLPAGDYTVVVGDGPEGTEITTPSSDDVSLDEGEDYVDADFGFTPTVEEPTGSISDTVWFDEDGDGIQDISEEGIPSIEVTLLDEDGNVIATTTTGGDGSYIFDDLPAGDYTVVVGEGPDGTGPSTSTTDEVSLEPGEDYTDADFGFTPAEELGSIGDTVWFDEDGDGVEDATEEGIENIVVTLIDENSEIVGATLTDENGNYTFDDLPAGDYTVIVGNGPDGTTPSTDTNDEVSLEPGENYEDADFGFAPSNEPLGTIGDYVWLDTDGEGTQDEPGNGIGDVAVTLVDESGNVIGTVLTDENGYYEFTDLPTGEYTVIVGSGPDGTVLTTPATDNVSLAPGEDYTDADFGFTPTDMEEPLGTIGDYVWLDTDGEGDQDEPGNGISNVTVTLVDESGNVIGAVLTDENGYYEFTDLPAGEYTVVVGSGPDSTVLTTPANDNVSLAPSENYTDADFGFTPTDMEEPTGSIGDYVWLDADGEGDQDEPSNGIDGVAVTLVDESGNVIGTVLTDENGYYEFTDLPAGEYIVIVGSGPDSTVLTTPANDNVSLAPSENYTDADFGFTPTDMEEPTGSIGDYVWLDADGEGDQDEPMGGIFGMTLTLVDENGNVIAVTTTNQDGYYEFDDVPAGTYTIVVGQGPDGTVLTTPANNTVNLDPGQEYTDADFGFTPIVEEPANIDGVVVVEGVGIGGIVITLVDENGTTIATVMTDENGNYEFPDVPAGTYTIVVGQGPDNTTPSSPTTITVVLEPGMDVVAPGFEFTNLSDECINLAVTHDVVCDGDDSYTVAVIVTGGEAPYTINSQVSESGQFEIGPFTNGMAYNFTVTDNNGCTLSVLEAPEPCTTLPVEIISYTGEVLIDGNLLKWVTASEVNNDYFTLESSTDGVNFTTIDTQDGLGTSSTGTTYNFLDKDAPAGISYYRLSQTDFDGTTTEVGVISLVRGESGLSVSITPVPAISFVNVSVNTSKTEVIQLNILDVSGKLIAKQALETTAGVTTTTIDIGNFAAGMYLMVVESSEQVITSKFVKK